MIKLSIVIVTHDVETYIIELLSSILEHLRIENRKKIEIIITDDCSTDQTVSQIHKFFQNNIDIRYVLHENEVNAKVAGKGLNYGIDAAIGEYIHFIDGDDIINSNIYNLFFGIEKQGIDIFEFSNAWFNKTLKEVFLFNELKQEFQDAAPYEKTISTYGSPIMSYLYGSKFIRTRFLKDYQIRFDEINSSQDKTFLIDVFEKNPVIKYINKVLLYYRCGIESISTGIGLKKFNINQHSTKELVKLFPFLLQRENNWQVYLLAHSKSDEIPEVIEYFENEEIYSDTVLPNNLDFRLWGIYLCNEAIKTKNPELLKIIIENNRLLKEIVNIFDYKVSNHLASMEIRQIILLKIFLEMKERNLWEAHVLNNKIESLLSNLDLRMVFFKEKSLNLSLYLECLNEILHYLSEEEIRLLKVVNHLPSYIKGSQDIIDFIKTYEAKKNIKHTFVCIAENDIEANAFKMRIENSNINVIYVIKSNYKDSTFKTLLSDKDFDYFTIIHSKHLLNFETVKELNIMLQNNQNLVDFIIHNEIQEIVDKNLQIKQTIDQANFIRKNETILVTKNLSILYEKFGELFKKQYGMTVNKRMLNSPMLSFFFYEDDLKFTMFSEEVNTCKKLIFSIAPLYKKRIMQPNISHYHDRQKDQYKKLMKLILLKTYVLQNQSIHIKFDELISREFDQIEKEMVNEIINLSRLNQDVTELFSSLIKEEGTLNEKQKSYFYKRFK